MGAGEALEGEQHLELFGASPNRKDLVERDNTSLVKVLGNTPH